MGNLTFKSGNVCDSECDDDIRRGVAISCFCMRRRRDLEALKSKKGDRPDGVYLHPRGKGKSFLCVSMKNEVVIRVGTMTQQRVGMMAN